MASPIAHPITRDFSDNGVSKFLDGAAGILFWENRPEPRSPQQRVPAGVSFKGDARLQDAPRGQRRGEAAVSVLPVPVGPPAQAGRSAHVSLIRPKAPKGACPSWPRKPCLGLGRAAGRRLHCLSSIATRARQGPHQPARPGSASAPGETGPVGGAGPARGWVPDGPRGLRARATAAACSGSGSPRVGGAGADLRLRGGRTETRPAASRPGYALTSGFARGSPPPALPQHFITNFTPTPHPHLPPCRPTVGFASLAPSYFNLLDFPFCGWNKAGLRL